LNEAISYMQQQQQAFRDVAILGVTVPGQLCVVALPLAFTPPALKPSSNITTLAPTLRSTPQDQAHQVKKSA